MFPIASSEELLALNQEDLREALEGQENRAIEFIVSGRHSLIGDDAKLLELSEKVFWASYVRLTNKQLSRLLRLFPYADRMLAKYGMDKEEILQIFLDHLSALLLGVSFDPKNHELKNLMERQANHLFEKLERHEERLRSFSRNDG